MTMSFDGQNSKSSYDNIYGEKEFDRPIGMLTRDQRTVMTREENRREAPSRQTPLLRQLSKRTFYSRSFERQFFNMCDIPRTNVSSAKLEKHLNLRQIALNESDTSQRNHIASVGSNCHKINQSKDNSIRHHHRRQYRRSRYGVSMFSKLFEVVAAFCVVGFFLECSGAPTMQRDTTPKWLNPCGIKGSSETNSDLPPPSDLDILQPILIAAKLALNQASSFKEEFVKRTFNTEFHTHNQNMHQHRYDWLPTKQNIPKHLGKELSEDYLQWLEGRMDDTLRNTFHYLQRFAVGFEQVVDDQRELRKMDEDIGLFVDKFTEVEGHLYQVLCEVQTGMSMRKVQRPEDVARDIMGPEYRALLDNSTHRNLRDWVIYRDYINALEYIVQVMEHLVETKAVERSNAK